VGDPGTSVSWYGVKRNAVETVWLHAIRFVLPIRMSGTPISDAPCALALPGIVICAW
jgi:hypothetical protein